MRLRRVLAAAATAALASMGGQAHAALTSFQTFVGTYGISTDGFASLGVNGTLTANIPAGATVAAAYLYTATSGIGESGVSALTGSFGSQAGSQAVAYTALGANSTACCTLTAGRMDVTSVVSAAYSANASQGTYNFSITEGDTGSQDGEALVVVYRLASLDVGTVAIFDGFASSAGDLTTLNLGTAVNKTPGFSAEMRLGISYSDNGANCAGSSPTGVLQVSSVVVNGTTMSNNAGCNDDSVDRLPDNGNLMTMGGDDDAFSSLLPGLAADHERYNLSDVVAQGATSIAVGTSNASRDDNLFLAVFRVGGGATDGQQPSVPEPMSLALVALALAGLGAQRRFSKRS